MVLFDLLYDNRVNTIGARVRTLESHIKYWAYVCKSREPLDAVDLATDALHECNEIRRDLCRICVMGYRQPEFHEFKLFKRILRRIRCLMIILFDGREQLRATGRCCMLDKYATIEGMYR